MGQDLTQGSVVKNLLAFSLPYLLSYLLQKLYGIADLFIIGQFEGVAETTAVSVGAQIMHMLTVMIVGLSMGATVCIGQAVGGKDRKRTAVSIGNTVTFFLGLSLLLTAVLFALRWQIVAAMSTPTQAVEGTVAYLTICFIGIPFITAYNIISAIFRSIGDSKSPMHFIFVACVTNIGLDYLFMGGLHLGPVGAALGTTISQIVSVLLALTVIAKRRSGIVITRKDLKLRWNVMGQILRVGIPVAVQDGLIQIAFIVITVIVNRRGLADAAAVGIVEKFIGFLFLVPSALEAAIAVLAAQNIGAGRQKRAKTTLRYAVRISLVYGIMAALVMQLLSAQTVALFVNATEENGADVIHLGGGYLRGYAWDCIFAGIHFCFSGYFCACGKAWCSFLHNIISVFLVRIPGAYLTSKLFADTLFPMGLVTAVGSLVSVIICLGFYAAFQRKEKRLTEQVKGAE